MTRYRSLVALLILAGFLLGNTARASTLSISNSILAEPSSGSAMMQFTVSLDAPAAGLVTVSYSTANDTALAGADYQSTSGQLAFLPGNTIQLIDVSILADVFTEPTETFFVNLALPTNATIAIGQGTGTILDTAVPEPGSFILAIGGAAALLLATRRRQACRR